MARIIHHGVLHLFDLVAEPKVEQIIQFAVYLTMAFPGAFIIIYVPETFQDAIGRSLVYVIGSALLLGGLAGAIAVLPGRWWLERMAIVSIWGGLAMFAVLAAILNVSPIGLSISICCGLLFIVRWRSIRRYQYAPGR